MCVCARVCVCSDEGPDGDAGQTDVGLRGPAEVDGVTVQADVLQGVPDVVEVLQIAEGVLVHRLDVIPLRGRGRKHRMLLKIYVCVFILYF